MGHHPRIESSTLATFTTTRTRCSELWYGPDKKLTDTILGYLARYAKRHSVSLYGFSMHGSHLHSLAQFPLCNRASFMRDFNSMTAKALPRHFGERYSGGRPWARRYSGELVFADSLEKQFFYTVLQPVQDGLVSRISEWPGYNCFHDAIWGIQRKFKVTRWTEYKEAKRRNKKAHIKISDFQDTVTLKYERLPGHEHRSQKEYARLMTEKLEFYRLKIIKKRQEDGKTGFLGREAILATVPGSRPKSPKTSNPGGKRPRFFCGCPQKRLIILRWYFRMYFDFKQASHRYRNGELGVEFPPGMYKPPWVCIKDSGGAPLPEFP